MNFSNETEIESKEKVDVKSTLNKELVLFNDDVHSFDYVIEALVKVCKHSEEQAEQSAYIVHFNGKCSIKNGPEAKLRPMKEALVDRELRVKLL
jgi:ATP-dependent Clp protease adaptor protein ClpS